MCDPPYGTTACKWDSVLPFDKMWAELNRVSKNGAAIVLFGSEPFSSALRMSNIKNYKYDWIWVKNNFTGFLNAKKAPLKKTENISVFRKEGAGGKHTAYYPIMSLGHKPYKCRNNPTLIRLYKKQKQMITNNNGERYPVNVLNFERSSKKEKYKNYRSHPTQKPVALLEYLVKTYSLENQVVLDFTMGSGSTGVACVNTNRKFIGIELEKDYFKIACGRISEACDKGLFSENEDAGTTK